MHCLSIKVLEKSKYNKMAIKLVSSNYHYISIDSDVLIEAAEQAKWGCLHNHTQLFYRYLKNLLMKVLH
ncbi:MAG: hypothetical protein COZ07_00700 [Candidatus Infernicultor aquiphilus]|uniref:Uncharacterized protein n=1 Tax=Candidatus Infernicultor aquiphilus TaxID=1805029 RepID=A0A1J5GFZ9_9BACT|nr:MAG: hypothetical protein AUK42_07755 [Candidatus Atribacteria bacterium CG2_30_33_13]PIW11798.1 MAG: hypothetical protein COW35_05035 [Candidatus Atribacteria bacterium CG17_big_fil_post_rev_8_21_14_2_50_34_11]PIX34423.1 MAG: hypothetical protein COZ58_03985 [Candidatus Atribacteria bacterium CG_4_8_14_3_um_filter_34_18]PIY33845.1 MAG: hypothetical protein COZ07_00700 [Candidatus Atribacteria bacterium CG_4_10_14_3_um_filter_34_13]